MTAIGVMQGAGALGAGVNCTEIPQAGPAASADEFTVYSNYVALPPSEAFRIEYWQLEEAKIRRQPPEKELSRQICLIVGGGNGVGRETALLAAQRGAHVIVADRDLKAADAVVAEMQKISGKETGIAAAIDVCDRESIRQALRATIAAFGGLDIIVNTAAIFPSSPDGQISDGQWGLTLDINVTANHRLLDEAAKILAEQDLTANILAGRSGNTSVTKTGRGPECVSQTAGQ